jgi:DNA-binding protein HU-beta
MANSLMTKTQLLAHFADKFDITKAKAAEIVDEFANVAIEQTKLAGEFTIPGIGKLVLTDRAARMGRNPSTGETIEIPAKRVAKIRLAKSLKDSLEKSR